MKFNKLVRDKIPEIIAKDGKKAVTRILTDEEFKIYLEKKLDEEVAEFHESKSIEELADILEVIYALSEVDGTIYNLLTVWQEKSVERGGFTKKILLEEICDEKEPTKETELKPCPFCGGQAEIIKRHVYADDARSVKCSVCSVVTLPILINHPTYNANGLDESTRYTEEQAEEKAAELWNRRAGNEE